MCVLELYQLESLIKLFNHKGDHDGGVVYEWGSIPDVVRRRSLTH